MDYQEVLAQARINMAPKCRVCPECNGIACKGELPGVGGYGNGRGFTICREYLRRIKINMDTMYAEREIATEVRWLGQDLRFPLALSPIGGMAFNYNGYLTDYAYNEIVSEAAGEEGILAFSGDTPDDRFFLSLLPLIRESHGEMISTIKPWENSVVIEKALKLKEQGAQYFAMDIDSAGLPALKKKGRGGLPKSTADIRELQSETGMGVVLKGIMTGAAAEKALDAGAEAIIVSSHGGRHYEDAPATAEVLPEIRSAVGDDFPVWVDGGIRSGADIFKVIALGADGAMVGRPVAIAAHGGGKEGVKLYIEKLRQELEYTMRIAGCSSLEEIGRENIRFSDWS